MRFSRQEYWSGLPFPLLPNPGIEPMSLTSPELAGDFFTTRANWAGYYFFKQPKKEFINMNWGEDVIQMPGCGLNCL